MNWREIHQSIIVLKMKRPEEAQSSGFEILQMNGSPNSSVVQMTIREEALEYHLLGTGNDCAMALMQMM